MVTLDSSLLSTGSVIPETRFPSLHTVYQSPVDRRSHNGCPNNQAPGKHQKLLSKKFNPRDWQLDHSSIDHSYAKFIIDFTGRDEVAFHTANHYDGDDIPENQRKRHSIVHARQAECDNGSRIPATLEYFDHSSNSVPTLDFRIEVLNASEPHDFSESHDESFTARLYVEDGFVDELVLRYHPDLPFNADALHLFDSILLYLRASPSGESEMPRDESILNFPPLYRPPQFREDAEIGENEDKALLHAAFERRAAQFPDRVALDFLELEDPNSKRTIRRQLTYAEMDALTTSLAEYILVLLGPHGKVGSSVVPILLPTSAELYISYLAVLKAGLAFCPLPIEAPPQRLQDICDDLQPRVMIGKESFRHKIRGFPDTAEQTMPVKWIDIDTFVRMRIRGGLTIDSPTSPRTLAQPDESDVAYIMYTSGSTGKPKGVQITHLAATCSIAAHATSTILPPASDGIPRFFQFAAPTFDPSLMEIFVTLSTGSTLCSASRDLTLTDLEAVVSELGATVMMATPSMAALLRRSELPSLRSLWTMGETVLRKNIHDFARTSDDAETSELCNAYGPTEGSINCTLLPHFHPEDRGSIIGPPLSTCSLFILDSKSSDLRPVPRGFVGELAIGGPQVSVGYLNRPEQNAKAFVVSPRFGRLYFTGDKARIVTDRKGQHVLEFLGRIDTSQVKLSGRRVDLGEIDTVVSSYPGVKEAVTVSYKRFAEQPGSEEAVCFIVLDRADDHETVKSGCRENVARYLPSYMCPSKYFVLSQMPRSLAGKIDRKSLARMVEQLWQEESQDSSSHSSDNEMMSGPSLDEEGHEIEDLICLLLSQLVGSQNAMKSTTNLFSMGIDSLRAIRFLQLARDAGITELNIADVLGGITPSDLADMVVNRRKGSGEGLNSTQTLHDTLKSWDEFRSAHLMSCSETLALPAEHITKILPTTATQSGMLTSFLRSSPHEKLQDAWLTVLKRHEAYRMIFVPLDDALAPFGQCILDEECTLVQTHWRIEQLETNENVALQEAIQRALRAAEAEIALDRPPFQLQLIRAPDCATVIFSIFHGIFDGASLQLLFDEITAEYRKEASPRRTEVQTAIGMHYKAHFGKTVEFWSRQLEDCDPVPFPQLTGLRSDVVTRAPSTSFIFASVTLDGLRDGAKLCSTSPLSILQAAWSLILITYKDSINSSTFGSVISGRLDEDTEVCMGPTFTTIPITIPPRVLKSNTTTTTEVLRELASINAKSLSHLQIPLNSIVASNGGLYYDTLLAFQDFATANMNSELWSRVDYPAMGNDFAVMIEVWPDNDGSLRLRATYTDEYLNDSSATLMLQQFSDMIDFILLNPDELYLDGRFVSAPSKFPQQLPSHEVAENGDLLHSCFERNAKFNPNDVALVFKNDLQSINGTGNLQWTYAELNDRANKLACYLVERYGSLEDKIVPFSLYKSPELYVAILAILKAGGAWCPIDPTFPPSRRHDLIARTSASMLLVANETVHQEKESIPCDISIIDISESPIANGFPNDNAVSTVLPVIRGVSMAYLIWTSGTTGLPKGVQVQHSAAAVSMKALRNLIPKSRSDEVRCLQFSQPTFDVFVQDLFYTWGLRGTVIAAPKDIMLGSFPALSNATNATHAHLTPAFATIVSRNQCQSLEVVTMIGEALQQPVADDWGQNMLAFNTYGPAEASVVSTVKQFGGIKNDFKSTNVGVPLPSVGAFIVSDNRVVMKHGVGELALSGPQLARGYWKDAKQTAAKFHWNDSCQENIYMTGDIVRQLHDGSFEFVGRRDDLVKINGMRVELSEISFALRDCHANVEQVITFFMARADRPNKVLVTFLSAPSIKRDNANTHLITNTEAIDIASTAAAEARRTLPEHMIPGIFVVLNEIPVTASAKVDRKALSAAYESLDLNAWESNFSLSESSEWTEEERLLLNHITEFSGSDSEFLKRSSRLAILGLDSIGAIRFTARLKTAGYKLSAADVLHSQTLGELCNLVITPSLSSPCLDDSQTLLNAFHNEWYPKVLGSSILGEKDTFVICPTLPLQENLLSETFRNYESYWSNHFFELDITVNLDRMSRAWLEVARQNEALRAGFLATASVADDKLGASTFLQVIYEEPHLNWSRHPVTLENFATKAREASREIARQQQDKSFIEPPWAVTIFDHGDGRTMMLSIHHSIHDGNSLKMIKGDLQRAYLDDETPNLQRHQLREAAAILQFTKTSAQEDLAFWQSALSEFAADEDDSPDHANTINKARKYNTHTVSMGFDTDYLQEAAQKLQCSSATSILRAAWGCMVSEFLETDHKIVMGEVLSERLLDSKLDDVIGPLVSLVPVPISTSGTVKDILLKHDSINMGAFQHRHANPGMLRKLIKRPKQKSLYPAVFVFHPHTPDSRDENDLWIDVEDFLGLNVEHDLTLNVEQQVDGGLLLEVSVEASVLDIYGVEILAKQLSALITTMISYPNSTVSELTNYFPRDLISVTAARVLQADTVVSDDNPLCWFEHWARVSPDWPAVEIAESVSRDSSTTHTWTYSKLDEEASRVAAFIHSHGIHGRMIGMCLGRSLASFAVTLGIFKSGNAYLPIDQDLPKERKAFLLRDSDSAIFFTDESPDFVPEGCMAINFHRDQYQLTQYEPLKIVTNKNAVAYLLYTSGSTGNPKGVLISRGNLTAFCEAQSEYICEQAPVTRDLGGTGKYLGLASIAFDVHVGEMFLAWRHGLSLVTGKKSMLLDDLPLALQELKITHASFVPSLLDQVGLIPSDVPLLKYLSVGGEKISQRTLETFGDSDSISLINAYGPTEATIGCCSACVSSKSNLRNIGRPLGDTVAHVLIPGTLTYTKRGMEGELCLTGSLVGIGYHNRDTGAFVEDFHGEKMYRTGDLVRLMPDDSIEIFGRSDDQTKIRGQRLELGEVSECVRALCSTNSDVASLITKHPELSRMQLISFVATSKSKTRGEKVVLLDTFEEINLAIRNGCRERLPAYMVPDVVIPISYLPLAVTSGKADMKQLKSLFAAIPLGKLLSVDKGRGSAAATASRALNEDEIAVVEILKTVLPSVPAEIGPSTNIFEIGLDSLVAISLSIRMRQMGCAVVNEILRTCFCQVGNDILQIILTADSTQLSWTEHSLEDCSTLTPQSMQDEISHDIVQKIQSKPPIRLNIFFRSNPTPLLLISIHHALYDAESLTILMEDVSMRYQGMAPPERPVAGSLVDHVASLDENGAFEFWTKRLEGFECQDQLGGIAEIESQAQTAKRILRSSLSSLEICASKLHVTLPSLAQAVFGLAMAKSSSVNDFVFGLVLSGRSVPIPDIDKLLAPTITTVPQRIDLRGSDMTVFRLLSSLQKTSGQLLQFQHTSLRAIHKWVEADRPLFNCLFSFIKTGDNSSENELWKEVESYMPPDYPFAVEFEARSGSDDLVIRAGYTSEFGSSSKVENLLEMMELLIDTIAKGDDITINSLGIQTNPDQSAKSMAALSEQEEHIEERTIKDVLLRLGDFSSDHISRNSTFFRLGIDSVIAIRFAKELRNAGFEVSSSDIGKFPSIAALGDAIAARNNKKDGEEQERAKVANGLDHYRNAIPVLSDEDKVTEIYTCTPLQGGLLTQTVATGGKLYLHHPAVKLTEDVDVGRLKEAWLAVVNCHDILKTTFHYFEDSETPWIAAVHKSPNVYWVEEEASGWIDQSIAKIVQNTTFPTPESFSTPPLRATILRSPFSTILVISIHHSLYDGWSLPLIFDALAAAYAESLKKPSASFFEAAKLITDQQAKSVDFWLQKLEQYQSIAIPSSSSKDQATTSFAKTTVGMPTADILQLCKSNNINLQSAALLAYGKALCCFVKRRDVVFGHVVSGRSLPLLDVEQLVGPLFNTIPFRVKLDNPWLRNQEFVSQVQDTVINGQENQHASLQTIQKLWRQKNYGEDVALLDALFVFQKVGTAENTRRQELWSPVDMEDDRDATEYGLNVEIEQGVDEVIIRAASPAGRINMEDLNQICNNIERILRDILDSPQRSVTAYPEELHNLPLEIAMVKKSTTDYQDVAHSPILSIVRSALSEVAKIPEESISLDTSIFSLGVDSIAAIRVASICRRNHVQISVADILQGLCLGGIVRVLLSKNDGSTTKSQVQQFALPADVKSELLVRLKYSEDDQEEILPCIAGQEYHLASWLNSGRTFYEPTWAFYSREKLDPARLASVWHDLQIRHPILRTVFSAPKSDKAYQIVLKPHTIPDSTFTHVQTTKNLIEVVKSDIRQSALHPSTLFAPPISLRLIQNEKQDALLIRFHHSLYDAWSMTTLINELSLLYLNKPLPPTPDYKLFVQHTHNSLAVSDQKAYWKSTLSSAQRTMIGNQTSDLSDQSQNFVWVKSAIENYKHISDLARRNGTSIGTILILAFSRALAHFTKTTSPTFGFFQVGRSSTFENAENVMGPTVNLLPVTVNTVAEYPVTDLQILQKIQEDMSRRVPHEQSHLRDVLSWIQEEKTPEPLFNASLNLLFHNPTASSEVDPVDLLRPMNIGVPTNYTSKTKIDGETAVDVLDTGYLAKRNMFVDAGPSVDGGAIDFGVKVDSVLMGEDEVREFVGGVVREVEKVVKSLECRSQ
ncbi:nonribosomal siderophore peptide synthase protein [Rutstroemia sp. NJR-2017a WRK4]|nr:nonribosomal siderophore peptide synthase protein [Rutstroemia sp. NJR-2017a WRK4]